MSKRNLKKYLLELNKSQLEDQIIELYDKFKEVKVYYDFVFNPKEKNLVKDAKLKITNEYFPTTGRKAKMRRSTAQKFIKQFIVLGVDDFIIADIMLYSIEIAQALCSEKEIKQEAFYKSLLNTYNQSIKFMIEKGILADFKSRVEGVKIKSYEQNWINKQEFNILLDKLY